MNHISTSKVVSKVSGRVVNHSVGRSFIEEVGAINNNNQSIIQLQTVKKAESIPDLPHT